jgi:hypothetical protein
MDPESQKKFDALILMDPNDWTEEDRAFLQARRAYLSDAAALGEVSEPAGDAPSEPGAEDVDDETAPKKKSASTPSLRRYKTARPCHSSDTDHRFRSCGSRQFVCAP